MVGCSFDPSGLGPGGSDASAPLPDAGVADPADATEPDSSITARFCDPGNPALVACWDFEPRDDPAQLVDGSSHDNHGTVTGAAMVPGVAGHALGLTPGTVVTVPDSASLDADDALTLEGWVRLDSLPQGRAMLIDNQGQWALSIVPSGQVRCLGMGAPASTGTVPPGAWTHVACAFDGRTQSVRFYIDGIPSGDGSASAQLQQTSTVGLVIGADSPCQAPPCNDRIDGAIDQLRVWRSARTAADLCEAAGRNACDE